jgi:hypothetical protein
MRSRLAGGLWAVVALAATGGCGRAPEPAAGTGAREAGLGWYEALVRQDWPAAYAALDPGSKTGLGVGEFARLARQYRRRLGFEPRAVRVRSCEEQGDRAIAHVTLTGRGASRSLYRDAVALRRGESGWAVVLPPNFGRPGR